MLPTAEIFPQIIPWFFLVTAVIAAFVKPKLWPFSLLCTLVSGLLLNTIDLVGLGVLTVIFTVSYYGNRLLESSFNPRMKFCFSTFVILSCIALAAHILPGFNNLQVLSYVEKSINSESFNLYLNFDKPMILFALLILYPAVLMNKKAIHFYKIENNFKLTALILVVFIVIFSLAMSLSLITFEPELPRWWWLFALNNLLFTCVVEEVFFRGVIQQNLSDKYNPLTGIVITSILFGIAHFGGGLGYIVVATLAGALYGVVYLYSGKLWQAILIHFSLNMVHLYLFTYPLIKS
ncbi:MAG: CPBP family intramembrane metalloprotease [Colwellia sp.]|nr:CPBP family intramembrane metalloprotease [Colwellia sp.]